MAGVKVADKEPTIEGWFWSHVDYDTKDTGRCWPAKALLANGYGRRLHMPRRFVVGERFSFEPHRLAYELMFGPMCRGLEVDHACHIASECNLRADCPHRACCNPYHLEPVPHLENVRRSGVREGSRERSTTKLNLAVAQEIRERYAAGGVLHRELAAAYGVTTTNIGCVLRGETWR